VKNNYILKVEKITKSKSKFLVGLQWHMSIILATWEAENRRITVQGQLRQNVLKNHPHLQINQSKID
jgi:hypothetical protein